MDADDIIKAALGWALEQGKTRQRERDAHGRVSDKVRANQRDLDTARSVLRTSEAARDVHEARARVLDVGASAALYELRQGRPDDAAAVLRSLGLPDATDVPDAGHPKSLRERPVDETRTRIKQAMRSLRRGALDETERHLATLLCCEFNDVDTYQREIGRVLGEDEPPADLLADPPAKPAPLEIDVAAFLAAHNAPRHFGFGCDLPHGWACADTRATDPATVASDTGEAILPPAPKPTIGGEPAHTVITREVLQAAHDALRKADDAMRAAATRISAGDFNTAYRMLESAVGAKDNPDPRAGPEVPASVRIGAKLVALAQHEGTWDHEPTPAEALAYLTRASKV